MRFKRLDCAANLINSGHKVMQCSLSSKIFRQLIITRVYSKATDLFCFLNHLEFFFAKFACFVLSTENILTNYERYLEHIFSRYRIIYMFFRKLYKNEQKDQTFLYRIIDEAHSDKDSVSKKMPVLKFTSQWEISSSRT